MDGSQNLVDFGAILRHPDLTNLRPENIEGGAAARRQFLRRAIFGKCIERQKKA